jgi:hypothetical protein
VRPREESVLDNWDGGKRGAHKEQKEEHTRRGAHEERSTRGEEHTRRGAHEEGAHKKQARSVGRVRGAPWHVRRGGGALSESLF